MAWSLGLLGAAGSGGAGDFELLETVELASDGEGLLFTSIPQNYTHLHLRWVAKSSNTSSDNTTIIIRPNNVSSAVYSWHGVAGLGSGNTGTNNTTSGTSISMGSLMKSGGTTNVFSAGTIDIMDYTDTSKLTTSLGFSTSANSSDPVIRINSGLYQETAAVTQMTVLSGSNAFVAGSRFSLFGVKG